MSKRKTPEANQTIRLVKTKQKELKNMPAKRKRIKTKEVMKMLGYECARTVLRLPFKRYPMNPDATRKTWLFDLREVEEHLAKRERAARN